jgi:ribosomal protein L21
MPKGAFTMFVRKHESIFFPIFTLQREMRRHICGLEFWERIRLNLCKKLNLGNRKAANFDLAHCRKAIKLSANAQILTQDSMDDGSSVVPESPKDSKKKKTSYDSVRTFQDDDNMSVASDMTRASTISTAIRRNNKKRKNNNKMSVKAQLKKQGRRKNGTNNSNNKRGNPSKKKSGRGWVASGDDNDSVVSFQSKARSKRGMAWMN